MVGDKLAPDFESVWVRKEMFPAKAQRRKKTACEGNCGSLHNDAD
jgi:hypothetical protein